MKILQLINSDSTIKINYLVDLIGTNDVFSIFQIKTISSLGVESIGLSDAAIRDGVFQHIGKIHTKEQFVEFCKEHNYSLYSYENLSTGSVRTTIYSSGYGSYSGGGIGEGEL